MSFTSSLDIDLGHYVFCIIYKGKSIPNSRRGRSLIGRAIISKILNASSSLAAPHFCLAFLLISGKFINTVLNLYFILKE